LVIMAIDVRTVTKLKASVGKFLTDTCTIYTRTATTDDYGYPSQVLTEYATGVACRLITVGTQNKGRQFADREILEDVYRLIVPTATTIDTDYVVEVNSEKYQVISITDKLTNELFADIEMKRIR
jgi:hypothetical protein